MTEHNRPSRDPVPEKRRARQESGVTAPPEGEPTGTGNRTVSIPHDLLAQIDARVGAHDSASYVAEAVRRQLQRDQLDDLLAHAERSSGPITAAERRAARKAVAAAMARPPRPAPRGELHQLGAQPVINASNSSKKPRQPCSAWA